MMEDKYYAFMNMIAYIANQCPAKTIDFHKLSKIFYFAEQKHLVKYGSKLVDDTFIAMENGPVPSQIYDMLKGLRFNPQIMPSELQKAFTLNQWLLTSEINPDMDWISNSEVACINEAIAENINLNFNELSDKSHDEAWKADFYMKSDKIAQAGGANDEMVSYVKNSINGTAYYDL